MRQLLLGVASPAVDSALDAAVASGSFSSLVAIGGIGSEDFPKVHAVVVVSPV